MKTWKRAEALTLCGGPCKTDIPAGAPMLEVRIEGLRKTFRRCAKCAGEQPPPDLPPLVGTLPSSWTRVATAELPFELTAAMKGRG